MIIYTLTDAKFFEDISQGQTDSTFYDAACEHLPPHWKVNLSGIWLMVSSPVHELPEYAFKIHISGIPSNAAEIIRRVATICYANDVPFKTARDPRIFSIMSSKHYARGGSSKLMTIYPPQHAIFMEIIEILHQATEDLCGPYILSDRRYRDCGIVHYRYGEIAPYLNLQPNGSQRSELIGPDGQRYQDDRLPYYRLPPWISDPFVPVESLQHQGPYILNQRYQVEEALSFSNSGGIYRAFDRQAERLVVLKEARPLAGHVRLEHGDIYSFDLLEHEFAILKRLNGLPGVVSGIEIFSEWQHRYLAESFVVGTPLAKYRARVDFYLFPFMGAPEIAENFCRKFTRIALQLVETVQSIHERGVLIGDLSPSNILIEPNTLDICLVDLEGAQSSDQILSAEFSATWATPGFSHERRQLNRCISAADDWYALGMVLYNLILPIQPLFALDQRNVYPFLQALSDAAALPPFVGEVVRTLLAGDPSHAHELLLNVLDMPPRNSPLTHVVVPSTPFDVEPLLQGIGVFLDGVCEPDRTDRLWPSDPEIFTTNPISLAYGASGPLLLQTALGKPWTPAQEAWLDQKTTILDMYPPGLYTGLAGLAYVYSLRGDTERALRLLEYSRHSPLLTRDSSLFQGEAGFALSCLLAHAHCHESCLLDWAAESGERLLASAIEDVHGCYWPSQLHEGKRELGMAFGGSGVALVLLYLSLIMDSPRFRRCAELALDTEINFGVKHDNALRWGKYNGDLMHEPYWLHGSGGIGATLIRFAALCKDERYKQIALQAGESSYSRFAVLPGQAEGMSGIGEFMLDLYQFTGNSEYRQRADMLATSISLYRVDGQHGVAFPGRGLLRLSCDYAYGTAGVGLFMHRLQHGGSRVIHDLPIFSVATKTVGR